MKFNRLSTVGEQAGLDEQTVAQLRTFGIICAETLYGILVHDNRAMTNTLDCDSFTGDGLALRGKLRELIDPQLAAELDRDEGTIWPTPEMLPPNKE